MAEFSFRHLKGSRRPLAFPHSLNAAITKSNSHLVNSISIFAPVSQKLLCELSAKISSLFYVLLYVASRPTSRYDIWRQEDVSAFVGTCTRNQRPNYSYHYHQLMNRKNYIIIMHLSSITIKWPIISQWILTIVREGIAWTRSLYTNRLDTTCPKWLWLPHLLLQTCKLLQLSLNSVHESNTKPHFTSSILPLTSLWHSSLAFAVIIFGMTTSFSTFLRVLSNGSPTFTTQAIRRDFWQARETTDCMQDRKHADN